MDTSSEILAQRAGSGDAAAFRSLLERHYHMMFKVAFQTLGQQADAEDLVQEICTTLPQKLGSFRGDSGFESWLYRVIVNAGRDAMRRRGAQARAATGWGEVEIIRRKVALENTEALGWLNRAMARLSPELRETVALVLGQEMTHAAAARVLGLSEGSVSWRMSEVKKELRFLARQEEMLK